MRTRAPQQWGELSFTDSSCQPHDLLIDKFGLSCTAKAQCRTRCGYTEVATSGGPTAAGLLADGPGKRSFPEKSTEGFLFAQLGSTTESAKKAPNFGSAGKNH